MAKNKSFAGLARVLPKVTLVLIGIHAFRHGAVFSGALTVLLALACILQDRE